MKTLLIFGLLLNAVIASAQVNFIDRSGSGLIAREEQHAAVFIVGDAVQMIAEKTPNANKSSQVRCGKGFCVIGQFVRSGDMTPLQGKIAASDYFPNLFKHMKKPRYLVEAGFYEDNFAKLYAYPTQCQEENLKTRKTLEITLEGIAAEQLYNFITSPEKTGQRRTALEKSDPNNFFYCEKMPQYHPDDIDEETGRLLKGVNPYYMSYKCHFEVDQAGQMVRRRDCRIYGGAVSAGGGS